MRKKKNFIWRFISGATKKFLNSVGVFESNAERIKLLQKNGLKIGKDVTIDPRVHIDKNFCYLVSIGDNTIVAANVSILAHDSTIFPYTEGHGRIGKVEIKENCILSAGSTILPGVTIGPNVLVGAGSVVNKDIPPNSCVAGVPARFYSSFDEMVDKHKKMIKKSYVVDCFDVLKKQKVDNGLKSRIIKEASKGPVYMKNLDEID